MIIGEIIREEPQKGHRGENFCKISYSAYVFGHALYENGPFEASRASATLMGRGGIVAHVEKP